MELCIWSVVIWAIYAPAQPDLLNVAGLAFGFKVVDLMSTILQYLLKAIVGKLIDFCRQQLLGVGKHASASP
eukprot:XP_001698635.1 predicted protein [Chlamydomonas reinhardtii]